MTALDSIRPAKASENSGKSSLLPTLVTNPNGVKASASSSSSKQEKIAVAQEFIAALTDTENRTVALAESVSARYDSWYANLEFPEYHTELESYRDIFVGVLDKAREQGGEDNPIGFLESLSPLELRALQKHHGLGDPIVLGKLDFEGAFNLLQLPDETRDINRDGLVGTGIGHSVRFPPSDAPREVLDAWEQATKGLDWGAKGIMSFSMWSRAGGANVILNQGAEAPQLESSRGSGAATSVAYLSDSFDWREFALSMISFEAENARYNTTDVQRGLHQLRLETYENFFDRLSARLT
jgi:hypothetical protein